MSRQIMPTNLVGLPGHGAFFKYRLGPNDEYGNPTAIAQKFESVDQYQQELESNPDFDWFDNPKLEIEIKQASASEMQEQFVTRLNRLEDENQSLKESEKIGKVIVENLTNQATQARKELDETKAELKQSEKELESANKQIESLKKQLAESPKPEPAPKPAAAPKQPQAK